MNDPLVNLDDAVHLALQALKQLLARICREPFMRWGHSPGNNQKIVRSFWQAMGLLPMLQLQPVFDSPKEFISAVEFMKILATDVVFVVQFLK